MNTSTKRRRAYNIVRIGIVRHVRSIVPILSAKSYIKQSIGYIYIASVVKGWFRALEVTYNEGERTFHPHFHVLINVPPSYFSGKYYLSQPMWMRLWRESLDVSYDPVVDVRRVRSSRANTKNALTRAILEVCKYPMKMSDLNSIMRHDAFLSFEKALFKRRLVAFGGTLKNLYITSGRYIL